MNVLSSKEGATILGASVVDDIVVVIILSVAVGMIGASTGGNTEVSFIVKLIEQGLFFIGIFFLVRFIAPYLLRLSQKMNIGSSVIIMSLIICLGMAYLADLVGLSSVVGAFFAGIAVGQTDAKTEIDFNIEAIGYAVFIPVFFASIGLSVTFYFGNDDYGDFNEITGRRLGSENGWFLQYKFFNGRCWDGFAWGNGINHCANWLPI